MPVNVDVDRLTFSVKEGTVRDVEALDFVAKVNFEDFLENM
jgi:hypothetical protein